MSSNIVEMLTNQDQHFFLFFFSLLLSPMDSVKIAHLANKVFLFLASQRLQSLGTLDSLSLCAGLFYFLEHMQITCIPLIKLFRSPCKRVTRHISNSEFIKSTLNKCSETENSDLGISKLGNPEFSFEI